MPVNNPRRTAEKGHGQKNGWKDERDADQRAADLFHWLDRGGSRVKSLVMHQPLDIFDDDDRIIDQKADGQHHAEQGERVDGIAEKGQHAEGPEQDDRNCHRRDQRRAPAL